METFEKSITGKVHSEADSLVATVETRVHDAFLAAMDSLVIPRVQLALKLVNVSSRWDPGSFGLDPDQRDFSGYVESLQIPLQAG